jgi:hypothetical protein
MLTHIETRTDEELMVEMKEKAARYSAEAEERNYREAIEQRHMNIMEGLRLLTPRESDTAEILELKKQAVGEIADRVLAIHSDMVLPDGLNAFGEEVDE